MRPPSRLASAFKEDLSDMSRTISWRTAALAALLLSSGIAAAPPALAQTRTVSDTNAPLVHDRALVIPNVPVGPFSDSLALDLDGQRLFATPQAAKSVAVIDLRTGAVSRMLSGIGNPHGIVYDNDHLFVSDGASDEVKVFDGKTFTSVKSIRVAEGADMASFDPVNHIFYVNSSGGTALGKSTVTAIDTRKMEAAWTVEVETAGIEGSAIDPQRQLLYVTMRDKGAIGVIDLKTRRVIGTWKMPATDVLPWAVAIDPARQRLFVACREAVVETGMRGAMVVLDAQSGKVMERMPVGGWADGIHYDAKRQLVHVSSGLGRVESFAADAKAGVRRLGSTETDLMGKASLFSPELDRLFVSLPRLGAKPAQVVVLKPSR